MLGFGFEQFSVIEVDSSLRDLVGHVETAAGETQIIERSGFFPAPTFPVLPATATVSVPPSVAVAGDSVPVTEVTLFELALMVS